jgi:hypothetical protein
MYRDRLPSRALLTRATVATLALFFTSITPLRLDAQGQSAATPQPQTERHGYGYGATTVIVPTVQTPQQPAATTDDAAVHLDQLMTLREWDATGVARLRPDERAALEAWVQKYRGDRLESPAHAGDANASTAVASNGDVSSLPPSQPSAPASAAPAAGYASAFAVPTGPPAANQAPAAGPSYSAPYGVPPTAAQVPPGYAPAPAYAPPQASQPAAFPGPQQTAPPTGYAPAAPQYQPTYQPNYQPAYQPNYQPAYQPPPNPQPTPAYAPQGYPAYAQPSYAPPAGSAPAPAVAYPIAPSAPYAQPVAPAPSPYTSTAAPASPSAPAGAVVKTGLAVQAVQVGNRFVSLNDGSMWDVYPGDRAEVGVWRAQDPVYVRLATTTTSGGFDRELVNATRNVLVRVKFAGQIENSGGGR